MCEYVVQWNRRQTTTKNVLMIVHFFSARHTTKIKNFKEIHSFEEHLFIDIFDHNKRHMSYDYSFNLNLKIFKSYLLLYFSSVDLKCCRKILNRFFFTLHVLVSLCFLSSHKSYMSWAPINRWFIVLNNLTQIRKTTHSATIKQLRMLLIC